jgi:hypothetical protein
MIGPVDDTEQKLDFTSFLDQQPGRNHRRRFPIAAFTTI